MWWILCDPGDVAALWAAVHLRAGRSDVDVLGSDELGSALVWELRLGEHAPAVHIELPDGRCLDARTTRGVLNRLHAVPPVQVGRAAEDDRAYAAAELGALHLAWLHALPCPVVNRPDPRGLAGAVRHPAEWAVLASRAGLVVAPGRDHAAGGTPLGTPRDAVELVVIDGRVTGAVVEPDVGEGARRLARLAEERLLGVVLERCREGLRFHSASTLPDLRVGGAQLLDGLRAALALPRAQVAAGMGGAA